MTIRTRNVTGRRDVHYASYDEVISDVDHLIAVGHRTLGNWSLGQICRHLAASIDVMLDGAPAARFLKDLTANLERFEVLLAL